MSGVPAATPRLCWAERTSAVLSAEAIIPFHARGSLRPGLTSGLEPATFSRYPRRRSAAASRAAPAEAVRGVREPDRRQRTPRGRAAAPHPPQGNRGRARSFRHRQLGSLYRCETGKGPALHFQLLPFEYSILDIPTSFVRLRSMKSRRPM